MTITLPNFTFNPWSLAIVLLILMNGILYAKSYDPRIDGERWDPPKEYQGRTRGQLVFRDRVPPHQVKAACDKYNVKFQTNKPRGCAWVTADKTMCYVITIDRPVYGTTPYFVYLHELGHCNGWPWWHP